MKGTSVTFLLSNLHTLDQLYQLQARKKLFIVIKEHGEPEVLS